MCRAADCSLREGLTLHSLRPPFRGKQRERERKRERVLFPTPFYRHTALDLAMAGGHREIADHLTSVGAPSGGGLFHRAALTIQAVWRLHRYRVRKGRY